MPLWHEAHRPEAPLHWDAREMVCVDEAQDLNPARRLLMRRLLKPGGRLVAIGDPLQGLYGFTGSDPRALEKLEEELRASPEGVSPLPLTICWRSPVSHLAAAARLCAAGERCKGRAAIEARAGAPEGSIVVGATFAEHPPSTTSAVLCRYNAPLLALFKALLRQGRPVRLAGGGEVAGQLRATLEKAMKGAAWAGMSAGELRGRLHDFAAAQKEKAKEGKMREQQDADDHAECLSVLLEEVGEELSGAALQQALSAQIEEVYLRHGDGFYPPAASEATLVLSSIHKAKGLERDRVWARRDR